MMVLVALHADVGGLYEYLAMVEGNLVIHVITMKNLVVVRQAIVDSCVIEKVGGRLAARDIRLPSRNGI
jgi:hypothetical protein